VKRWLRRRWRRVNQGWHAWWSTWNGRLDRGAFGLRRLVRRIWGWWLSRRGRYLLQGLPAVLAAATAIVFLVLKESRGEQINQYRAVAATAFQAGDYPLARIACERLVLLDDGQPEFRYLLAVTEMAQGNLARGAPLMDGLAPMDRAGYAPAHMWLARALLAGAANPESLRAAEVHLRRGLEEWPNDLEIQGLMGRLYLATGRPEPAEAHLLRAATAYPEIELDLARLYTGQKKRELARVHGQRAQRLFRERAMARIDDHEARLNWAEADIVLGDFPAAVTVLQEGLNLASNPRFQAALGRAYLLWSDEVGRTPKGDPGERLALLEKAMPYEGASPAVLDRLVAIAKINGPEADKSRATLRGLLAEGKSPALVHLALGLDAQERGKVDEARRHYEQAHQLAADMPLIMNNLAWTLARATPPDLPRALELVEAALARVPNQPRFRDTRGQILMKMGRWKEALADLEAALPVLTNSADLHRALAETYEHLGMAEMAAEHKRLAERPAP
jgi:tetratricopeptide (TPR) repeat protein